MSWIRIWVHIVFSTKNRYPFLKTKEIRKQMFYHIKENAEQKGIYIDSINGYSDHVHCLISLGKNQTVSKTVQLIKGESSLWFNRQKLIAERFSWQYDYWAVGVSEAHLQAVRNYIYEQEERHKKVTFKEEVENFMKKYGWQFIEK